MTRILTKSNEQWRKAVTKLPLEVHLMVEDPGRFSIRRPSVDAAIERFLDDDLSEDASARKPICACADRDT